MKHLQCSFRHCVYSTISSQQIHVFSQEAAEALQKAYMIMLNAEMKKAHLVVVPDCADFNMPRDH